MSDSVRILRSVGGLGRYEHDEESSLKVAGCPTQGT